MRQKFEEHSTRSGKIQEFTVVWTPRMLFDGEFTKGVSIDSDVEYLDNYRARMPFSVRAFSRNKQQ